MRNFLFLICVLCSINTFAQKTVANYHSDYFDKDYEISISTKKHDSSSISDVYIEVSGDRKGEVVTLDYKEPALLLSSLKEVRDKYEEWYKVAEDNNITDMTKEIPVKMPSVTVCWYGTKWYFAFNIRANFTFMILDSGKKIIVMHSKVTASSNRYIDQEFYWAFQSVDELDEFIKKLDYPKFLEIVNEKANNAELFK